LMVLTDGGIDEREIYFVTTDKALAELFSDLSRILLDKAPIITRYKRGRYSWMKLRVKNAYLARMLATITRNKTCIPNFIMKENDRDVIAKYLRIVASTDGGVAFYKNRRKDGYTRTERLIIIGCKNKVIREQLQRLFSKLGIKTRIVKEGLRISGRKNLTRFRDRIGFLPGCLVTSKSFRWKGHTKNEVLNLMLASYSGSAAPRNSVP